MKYSEVEGDLFNSDKNFMLVHCISSDFVLGAGIAKTFRDKYCVKDELIATGKKNQWDGNGYCIISDSYENGNKAWKVANLVTKEKCYYKPTYKTLTQSLEDLRDYCLNYDYVKIAMPLIGCGLDGLKWSKVSEIVKDIFYNVGGEIVVYHFK